MIQTYVQHDDKTYLVSTINRDSSSPYGGRYAETMVWEWDKKNIKRSSDSILMQGESPENSIYTHQKVVERIFCFGIKE
jgi:hypothetical protein